MRVAAIVFVLALALAAAFIGASIAFLLGNPPIQACVIDADTWVALAAC